ncbi:MAG TPA: ABC transporter ATP-binding protein [Stellaceae bacterium]|nr:ABC transporter ATP-binding protein [Stellaceae bacterium]
MSYLVIDHLTRSYAGRPVVQDLSLSVERGTFLALLGPSGCGKTTTLRMIAGLDTPDGGEIRVDGRNITGVAPHKRRMGVVFQSYALFPHMSIGSNVAFGLRMHGLAGGERRRRMAEAIALVGLADHTDKRPRQLSGGQQQRVALARALAIRPDVLLLDEPLSALDAKLRKDLREEMRGILRRAGATTVFVTHDQAEALSIADVVAVMNQGRIEQIGAPEEIFERPSTPFVASFVGRSASFTGIVEDGAVRVEGGAVLHGNGLPASGPVRIVVRPHRIRVLAEGDGAQNALSGTIAALDYTGELVEIIVDTPTGRVPVNVATADAAWHRYGAGQTIRVGWDVADTLVFPA